MRTPGLQKKSGLMVPLPVTTQILANTPLTLTSEEEPSDNLGVRVEALLDAEDDDEEEEAGGWMRHEMKVRRSPLLCLECQFLSDPPETLAVARRLDREKVFYKENLCSPVFTKINLGSTMRGRIFLCLPKKTVSRRKRKLILSAGSWIGILSGLNGKMVVAV